MRAYFVEYKMNKGSEVEHIAFLAKNKISAYDTAVYDIIPSMKGSIPYSAWVVSVTYQNGNVKYFNTSEGNPY